MCQAGKRYSLWSCNGRQQKHPDCHRRSRFRAAAVATNRAIAYNVQRDTAVEKQAPVPASNLEKRCTEIGLKMTEQRRVIARVLSDAKDHPDVEGLYQRATAIDPRISLATVYRTVRLFEECGLLERHDFRDGRARYEEHPDEHHDHLIDLTSGKVIEFQNEEIEALQAAVAKALGYKLVDHRLELYAVPLDTPED